MYKLLRIILICFMLIILGLMINPELFSTNITACLSEISTSSNSDKEIAAYIKEQMMNFRKDFEVEYLSNFQNVNDKYYKWIRMAFEETLDPKSGDYLKAFYKQWTYQIDTVENEPGSNYKYTHTFKISIRYFINKTQNAELERELKKLIDDLGIKDLKSDYEKTKIIYDYVCDTVEYDYKISDSGTYTAYSALIRKKSVCAGYAQLIHRLLKEAGLNARIITGSNHAWNMVEINGKYYFIDATFCVTGKDREGNFLFGFEKLDYKRYPDSNSMRIIKSYKYSNKDYKIINKSSTY